MFPERRSLTHPFSHSLIQETFLESDCVLSAKDTRVNKKAMAPALGMR